MINALIISLITPATSYKMASPSFERCLNDGHINTTQTKSHWTEMNGGKNKQIKSFKNMNQTN